MLKKTFISLTLAGTLAFGAFASAPVGAQQEQQSVETAAPVAVEADDVNSTEVNTVVESPTAQKMKQLEKAKNLKENDEYGGALTLMSMCIVILALVILSVLFLGFGKISSRFQAKKKREATGASIDDMELHDDATDSGEVIAAIAMALAEHLDNSHHDMEDTILTIRRMKRAYSPWNSKIYNLRQVPELKRNRR